jgi:HAE1 family hydrophobic/amphiphilic exporter-1
MIWYFIRNGISVSVLGMALLLFGLLALFKLPIQLTPDVSAPVISVETLYPGATPEDVEQAIIIEQEQFLKSLPGLQTMTSTASMGSAEIELEFSVGTDQQENIIRVNNALAQVANYPENVDEPSIKTSTASEQPVAWISVRSRPDHDSPVHVRDAFDYIEDYIKPRFERLPGIASVRGVFGGTPRQMQVMIDPVKLADRGIPISRVREAIRSRNRDVTGGDLDEGKRRFNIRTVGRYETANEIENTIIDTQDGTQVYLRDVGYARLGYAEMRTFIRQDAQPALAFGPQRERGSNLLVVMDEVQKTIRELNEGILRDKGLFLTQVTDSTLYVRDAVDMVRVNLLFGGALALGILMIFLRHVRSTLIVGIAIPLCVIGSFFIINASGRSINVISLAGLAFSIGVVLDASIVVLENIYRHRSMGKSPFEAAYDGTREVWTAILSSTLTNIVVFTPIITLADEAGQIFRDLAIAIVSANVLALIVSILIIPAMAARLLTRMPSSDTPGLKGALQRLFGLATLAERIHDGPLRSILTWLMRGVVQRLVLVTGLLVLAVACLVVFMPKTEYLPNGNRQSIIGILIPPQGYGLPEISAIGQELERRVQPLLDAEPAAYDAGEVFAPPLKYFFFAAFRNRMFLFTRPKAPSHVAAVPEALQRMMRDVPGTIAFALQLSIFSRDIMGSRAIDVDVIGPDAKTLTGVAQQAFFKISQVLPGARSEPRPGLEVGQPQMTIRPNWERAAKLGINVQDIGYTAWVLGDGAYIDDYFYNGDKMDLYMYSTMGAFDTLSNFDTIRMATPNGDTVPLSDIAEISFTYGLEQIRRVNNQRAVTLRVTPPGDISLEEAIQRVESEIIGAMQQDGTIPPGYTMRISGTSDKLAAISKKLSSDFVLALVLTYLTMVLVFRHWGHPFTVMLSVPIGLTGGVLGLAMLNQYLAIVIPGTIQSLDVLTMLGFVILLGSVINNPILIVQQAMNFMDEGMTAREAIVESTLSRVRPILMTTGTTIFGLMPLVLNPGAGSELYRGLGVVMFGGLLLGTVTTLVFIPAVMSLMIDLVGTLRRVKPARVTHPSMKAALPGDD